MARKRTIQAINEAIAIEMERDPRVILFGEDVEISLFGDTKGLHARFGPDRVRNTPISEQLMTGAAVGAAAGGYRVICHMMYGNFVYTGFDAVANATGNGLRNMRERARQHRWKLEVRSRFQQGTTIILDTG